MGTSARITEVELFTVEYEIRDLVSEAPLMVPVYAPGRTMRRRTGGIRLHTDAGVSGEHVGGNGLDYAAIPQIAHLLLGRDALDREGFYEIARRTLLLGAHGLGLGIADLALWDLAGRLLGEPVYRLLGGRQKRLRCYASTHVADRHPDGLCSPAAFAEFAQQCAGLGYQGFKIHPWQDCTIAELVDCVSAVGERVGGRMSLMVDPFNSVRSFTDAVELGRACDEYGYTWWEDPFRDGGVSIGAHAKLRELVKTPLLQPEHARGLHAHVDFMRYGAADIVRGDAYYDGITGTLKIAHAAEGLGLDIELHGPGTGHRQLLATLENSGWYEFSLIHPRTGPFHPPVYTDYSDDPWRLEEDGCVGVPSGPGLGATHDWEFIDAHRVSTEVIK